MKIFANIYKARPEVVIEHNGEEVIFSASVFGKKAFDDGFDVFDQINRYWASLPYPQQESIYKIFKEVYRGFDQIFTSDELYDHLNSQIKELVKYHNLERLETWVSMDPSFMVPEGIQETFHASIDDNNTRDKTYTRKDYVQIVSLALFLRCMVPIWGEYINSTRRDTGMEYKEYVAFQLLTNTGILESEAIQKLTTYIVSITKEKHRNPEKILNGISSEDMGFLLLALTCVRRLCVGDLRGHDPKSHLVSKVYKYLYQKVFNASETDSDVQQKIFSDNSSSSDQSKRSILESYRKRTELSLGELAELEFSYEDLYGAALRLAPTITEEEVRKSVETAQILKFERIGDPQLIMMSWVMKTAIQPKSVYYVGKNYVVSMLGVLEAVLWHWGHKYLSILSTSHMIVGQEEMIVAPVDSRGQIPLEVQQGLLKYYPYIWSTLKRNTKQSVPEAHPVLHSIDLVVDDLFNNAWRSTASEDKVADVFGEVRRKMPIHAAIKTELAKLLIDVETRRNHLSA